MNYDNNVVDGVMDLQLTMNTVGSSSDEIDSAALAALATLFPDEPLRQKFDNIMICIPYGSYRGTDDEGNPKLTWIAYASLGGYRSVYNGDQYCANEVTQLHETGHNWGLR